MPIICTILLGDQKDSTKARKLLTTRKHFIRNWNSSVIKDHHSYSISHSGWVHETSLVHAVRPGQLWIKTSTSTAQNIRYKAATRGTVCIGSEDPWPPVWGGSPGRWCWAALRLPPPAASGAAAVTPAQPRGSCCPPPHGRSHPRLLQQIH